MYVIFLFENLRTLNTRKFSDEFSNESLNIITTYNTKNPTIRNIINSALKFLKIDPILANLFKNFQFRWIYRQPPNLSRILCNSILNKKPGFIHKCGGKRCEICNILITTDNIKFNNANIFYIKSQTSCNSKFCIYVLKCSCGLFYIGECEDFRARVNLHTNQIKYKNYINVVVNFQQHQLNYYLATI